MSTTLRPLANSDISSIKSDWIPATPPKGSHSKSSIFRSSKSPSSFDVNPVHCSFDKEIQVNEPQNYSKVRKLMFCITILALIIGIILGIVLFNILAANNENTANFKDYAKMHNEVEYGKCKKVLKLTVENLDKCYKTLKKHLI